MAATENKNVLPGMQGKLLISQAVARKIRRVLRHRDKVLISRRTWRASSDDK